MMKILTSWTVAKVDLPAFMGGNGPNLAHLEKCLPFRALGSSQLQTVA
jgi:hypothetical protein